LATLAYITHPACALHEMGPDHPECPQRLAASSDHVSALGPAALIARHDATPAPRAHLARVHPSA
jgi:acetoin utilization deacetylase AcuC-like enzyme